MHSVKYILFATVILIGSACGEEDTLLSSELPHLTLHEDGFLIFDNSESFDEMVAWTADAPTDSLSAWESAIGFQSLYAIYREALLEPESIAIDTEDADARALILRKYGDIFVEAQTGLELDVPSPIYAPLVNVDGLVMVDGVIRQYRHDRVSFITDGDPSKIPLLGKAAKHSDIVVSEVVRWSRPLSGDSESKANWTKSCSHTNGKYKLLVYEEFTQYDEFGWPESVRKTTYNLKLRSLKKSLGVWFNHATGSLRAAGSVQVNAGIFGPNIIDYNYDDDLPYGHTGYAYFLLNYASYYPAHPHIWVRNHTGYGKNGTACKPQ